MRDGVTSEERDRIKALEREVKELRRANESLKLASAFFAQWSSTAELRRMLPQQRGVIIQVTSVHEFIPWAGYSAYTAAKAALSMFTKTVAQEVAAQGVRVLAIAPGAIKTPINVDVWSNPASLRDLDQKIAMNRPGVPDEIGRVAAFLASDLASYITGTSIPVDGGMLIYPEFSHGG